MKAFQSSYGGTCKFIFIMVNTTKFLGSRTLLPVTIQYRDVSRVAEERDPINTAWYLFTFDTTLKKANISLFVVMRNRRQDKGKKRLRIIQCFLWKPRSRRPNHEMLTVVSNEINPVSSIQQQLPFFTCGLLEGYGQISTIWLDPIIRKWNN